MPIWEYVNGGPLRPPSRHEVRRSSRQARSVRSRSVKLPSMQTISRSLRHRAMSSSSSARSRACSLCQRHQHGTPGRCRAPGSRVRRSAPPRSTTGAISRGYSSERQARTGAHPSIGPMISVGHGSSRTRTRCASLSAPAPPSHMCGNCSLRVRRSPTSSTWASSRLRLFRSDDGGVSFRLNEGLWDHEHRPHWEPGGGGLCLHTIIPDPVVSPDSASPSRPLASIAPSTGRPGKRPTSASGRPSCRMRLPRSASASTRWTATPRSRTRSSSNTTGGRIPLRRFRWPLDRDRGRQPPIDVRVPRRRRPEPTRRRVRSAVDLRRVPMHARCPPTRVPHERWWRHMGCTRQRAATGQRMDHRPTR